MHSKTIQEVDLARVISTNDKWWRGELARPVFQIICRDQTPTLPRSALEPKLFMPEYPRHSPPSEIIDAEYYKLSSYRYVGDAFPLLWMNFGAGALHVMAGGGVSVSSDTVWYEPDGCPTGRLGDMKIAFNPASDWARWIAALLGELNKRLDAQPVAPGMVDIGGTLDVIASLRGPEALLMDLLDNADEIKRLAEEEYAACMQAFDYFTKIVHSKTKLSSCWAGLLSSGTCNMLQSDFSYMISTGMFCEFARPWLVRFCEAIENPFYHLDGKGQLAHLPHIINIPRLRGIQWIPGTGQPPQSEWPEVFDYIEAAGLKVQLRGTLQSVETVLARLKHPERAHISISIEPPELQRACRLVSHYGCEE